MIQIQEIIQDVDHYIITFSDGAELYGMLIMMEEEMPNYVEFMEFDGEDIVLITEDEQPEEFDRLINTYYEKVIDLIAD
jgi:hypothetical protein